MQFYTMGKMYSGSPCENTKTYTYDGDKVSFQRSSSTTNCNLPSTQCANRRTPLSYGISDLAQAEIKKLTTLGDYSYLTLDSLATVSVGEVFNKIAGHKFNVCGGTNQTGSHTGLALKFGNPIVSVPTFQQKPPTGIFMLPPSVTRKMSAPLARKTLARSAAKAAPVVGWLASMYDAARLAQALLDDEPKPNNLQTPATPGSGLVVMLASEPTVALSSQNQNQPRQMPGVTFIDTDVVTNSLYQVTQINWNSPEPDETQSWLIKALARAMAGVLDAFGRELPNAMAELADLISGTITAAQAAAGEILSAVAQEILGQLSDNGKDGLPDEPGTLDYDLLAQAIRDGVSEALAEYEPPTPPAPPASETVISLSESLEEKLDQYFTIPDTEAGLAETISTNGFIFNPGYIP